GSAGWKVLLNRCAGGHSGGETPGPIPNPEAKPASADGTAPGRVWESRTPPDSTRNGRGPPRKRGRPSTAFPRPPPVAWPEPGAPTRPPASAHPPTSTHP